MRGSPINNLRSQQEGTSPYQRGGIRRTSDRKEPYDGSPDRLVIIEINVEFESQRAGVLEDAGTQVRERCGGHERGGKLPQSKGHED